MQGAIVKNPIVVEIQVRHCLPITATPLQQSIVGGGEMICIKAIPELSTIHAAIILLIALNPQEELINRPEPLIQEQKGALIKAIVRRGAILRGATILRTAIAAKTLLLLTVLLHPHAVVVEEELVIGAVALRAAVAALLRVVEVLHRVGQGEDKKSYTIFRKRIFALSKNPFYITSIPNPLKY